MTRKIIHIDMDAFFAAVEQRDFPQYLGKPLVVGGMPDSRGVVATCSYEARKFGIHSAMPSARAVQLCPQAIFVKPRFAAYQEASRQIREIFRQYTDLIEPPSLDEAYLDVSLATVCRGSAMLIAADIKKKITTTTELTGSAGVSYNKFLAKIASDLDKPNGIYLITPEQGPAFVETLPVGRFHGIGRATEKKMLALGIETGRDLKSCSRQLLLQQFGKVGNFYYDIARGIDNRPVNNKRRRKSFGVEMTFQQDIDNPELITRHFQDLLLKAMNKLQQRQLAARTITIKIKYANFDLITRSRTMNAPLTTVPCCSRLIAELLQKTELGSRKIRLLGVAFSSLEKQSQWRSGGRQLDLFS